MAKTYMGTTGDDYAKATKTLGLFWEEWEMYGGFGNDTLIGGNDHGGFLSIDIIDDTLDGGYGDDWLEGRNGNDLIIGGSGADTMIGGKHNDTYDVLDHNDVVIEYANEGIDTVRSSLSSYDLPTYVENLELNSSGFNGNGNDHDNEMIGNFRPNAFNGLDGDDTLIGAGGDDTLDGGNGSDRMEGGADDDIYYVNDVGDQVVDTSGRDTVYSQLSTYILPANIENLYLDDHSKFQSAIGNSADNEMVANSYGSYLAGHAGDDTLTGGNGEDSLIGGLGDDTLNGLDGDDYLVAYSAVSHASSSERDTMIGGDGADTFVMGSHSFGAFYTKGTGPDFATIQDFSRGEGDKIRVHSTDLYSIDHIGRNSYLYYGNDFVASVVGTHISMADLVV